MKKIPTIFLRDPENRSRLTEKRHPDCEWVFEGQGRATYKLDGACCMARDGCLYKRRELKKGKWPPFPETFECMDMDVDTGKAVGWVPVGDGPDDQWFREAFEPNGAEDGTYELMGPKVQGNPLGRVDHALYQHGNMGPTDQVPASIDGIEGYLRDVLPPRFEGIVSGTTRTGGWPRSSGGTSGCKARPLCGFSPLTSDW